MGSAARGGAGIAVGGMQGQEHGQGEVTAKNQRKAGLFGLRSWLSQMLYSSCPPAPGASWVVFVFDVQPFEQRNILRRAGQKEFFRTVFDDGNKPLFSKRQHFANCRRRWRRPTETRDAIRLKNERIVSRLPPCPRLSLRDCRKHAAVFLLRRLIIPLDGRRGIRPSARIPPIRPGAGSPGLERLPRSSIAFRRPTLRRLQSSAP